MKCFTLGYYLHIYISLSDKSLLWTACKECSNLTLSTLQICQCNMAKYDDNNTCNYFRRYITNYSKWRAYIKSYKNLEHFCPWKMVSNLVEITEFVHIPLNLLMYSTYLVELTNWALRPAWAWSHIIIF